MVHVITGLSQSLEKRTLGVIYASLKVFYLFSQAKIVLDTLVTTFSEHCEEPFTYVCTGVKFMNE